MYIVNIHINKWKKNQENYGYGIIVSIFKLWVHGTNIIWKYKSVEMSIFNNCTWRMFVSHHYVMVVHFIIKVQTGSHLYHCQCNIVVRNSVASF